MFMAMTGALLATSCNKAEKKAEYKKMQSEAAPVEKKATDIPFTVAERYFVKNTIKGKIDKPKIETQEEFDKVFGAATAMGKDGIPTKIDFTKQYVIAVVKPDTNIETFLSAVSLQKASDDKIIFTYKITKGKKQSFTSSVSLAIIVEKSFTGDVELKEIK